MVRRAPTQKDEKPVGDELLPLQLALDAGSRRPDVELEPTPSLCELARGVQVSVFLDLAPGTTEEGLGLAHCKVRGGQAVADATLEALRELTEKGVVQLAEPGAVLRLPDPLDADGDQAPGPPQERRRPEHFQDHQDGAEVLIGIIDVGGFDFAHEDFLDDEGKTRFLRIWDQGGVGTRPAPSGDPPFDYGAEFTADMLDAAIGAAGGLGVPAHEIERQSQLSPASHGTHVASIAASNLGVCPQAKIAGVLIALTAEDEDRSRSFYDSVRLVHAVEYLLEVAKAEQCHALSINISLGTNGHAHDGSDPTSRWIDAALVHGGCAVSVAAGNAGQEGPTDPDDIGFIMGRIHTSGQLSGSGDVRELQFRVVGNTISDISENELEVWYSNRDRIAVELILPDGSSVGTVEPGDELEGHALPDGTRVSVYNRLYHRANGDNVASIYLSPFLGTTQVRGIQPGTWTVRLHAREVRDGRYHGWLERDDPQPIVKIGPVEYWSFPSFFTEGSNVDQSSVSSLGCGERILCVANHDVDGDRINVTSSQGPTRDGRTKPDLAAPGTGIVAAGAFDPTRPWVAKSGTSMASPYVCGIAGLMLAIHPGLTAAQITGILRRTAQPLTGSYDWRDDAGFGAIDPAAALEEAVRLRDGGVTP